MKKLSIFLTAAFLAAPLSQAWALINDPNPPSDCSTGQNWNDYEFGYTQQDEDNDQLWNSSGCDMSLEEPTSAPSGCYYLGRNEATKDWLAFLDNECQTSYGCQSNGDYAGLFKGRHLCAYMTGASPTPPSPLELCTDLAEARCELKATWYVIKYCKDILNFQPDNIRQEIDRLCQPPSVCAPNAVRCSSGTLYTCNASGTGETSSVCPSGSCQNSTSCMPMPTCIQTQDAFASSLRNAKDGETLTLCQGTINIDTELASVANRIYIKCISNGQCTLNKITTGRFLSLFGNGVTIEGIRFQNAHNDQGDGGAVYFQGNNNSVLSCTFMNNSGRLGGALYTQGILTLKNSAFSGNSATFKGGAIYYGQYPTTESGGNTGSGNSAAQCPDIYFGPNGSCAYLY